MPNPAFITRSFILQSEAARRLYHEYAEKLPIIDYHCHLPPDQIAKDECGAHFSAFSRPVQRTTGPGSDRP